MHCDSLSRLLRRRCRQEDGADNLCGAIFLFEGGRLRLWDQVDIEERVLRRLHHVMPQRVEALLRACQEGGGVGTERLSGRSWSVVPLGPDGAEAGGEDLIGFMLIQHDGTERGWRQTRSASWHAAAIQLHSAYQVRLGAYQQKLNIKTTESRGHFHRAQHLSREFDELWGQLDRIRQILKLSRVEDVIPELEAQQKERMALLPRKELATSKGYQGPAALFGDATTPHSSD